jgi:hypothetical protein
MWRLVGLERSADGVVTQAEAAIGYLIYTPEGWFAEAFEYRNPDDGGTNHVLYCGTYETREPDIVIHQPRIHPNAALVGANLERSFTVEGNRFTLTAPTPNGHARLTLERVTSDE